MGKNDKDDKPSRSSLLNKASGVAFNRLKADHLDEWNKYMVEETERLGVEWSPRLNEEQRAEKTLLDLLEKHPNLAEKVAVAVAVADESDEE